jgi:protein-tyrosine-phosphatase
VSVSSVLFACNFNRVRSPMAEALARALYGDRLYVDSCGLQPYEEIDPMAVAVLAEIGVDAQDHNIQSFADLDPEAFDLVITFTPEATLRAEAMARGSAAEVVYWPLPDPTLVEGSREAVLDAYRDLRDRLRRGLLDRFGPPAAPAVQPDRRDVVD